MSSRWARRALLLVVLVAVVWLLAQARYVAAAGGGPNLGDLLVGMLGGVALFLFGMEQMADALQAAAGDRLRRMLAHLTRHRLVALLTGALVTAVVQSSTAVTVMVVGFISCGLMTLSQALGVILGADIGGTVTPQIVAFNVYGYALVFVALGFGVWFISKDNELRQQGRMLLGLGLVFYGLKLMSDAMHPFRDYQPFLDALASLDRIGLAVLSAAIFTALVHSSAATVGIAVVFASQGLVSLEAGIGLVLGANIGTCATAALAAIGKPREAQRAAAAHALFKLLGVLLVVPLLGPFAELVRAVSPVAPAGLDELAARAAEVPRQIANAHSLFNLIIAALFLPLCGVYARFLTWLLPDRAEADGDQVAARYLDRTMIDQPTIALGLVRREVGRIGNRLERMIDLLPPAVFEGDRELLAELPVLDDQVDTLYEAIAAYLTEVGQSTLAPETADAVLAAITATAELEAIGDVMETNLVHAAHNLLDEGLVLSDEAKAWLLRYHDEVRRAFRATMVAFASNDRDAAQLVVDMKEPITELDAEIRARHLDLLRQGDGAGRMATYITEMDIVENLRRIYYHSKRVAKLVVRAEGAAAWTSAGAA